MFSDQMSTVNSLYSGVGLFIKFRLKLESLRAVFKIDSYMIAGKTVADPRPVKLSQLMN